MTVSVNLQFIVDATSRTVPAEPRNVAFDVVYVRDKAGSTVAIFLPEGTGENVAHAINDAVAVADHAKGEAA